MMGFKPRFWPTLFTIVMMAIVIGLGTWQLHRLVWKTDLLATIATRMNGVPVALPAIIDDSTGWTFRSVYTTGHFAGDKALWLYGRTYEGKAGIHLLVPLIRTDGAPVLVDRGFVPFERGSELAGFKPVDSSGVFVPLDHSSKVPDVSPVDRPTEINGIVRMPEPGGLFMPSNQPDRNIWYSVDISHMSKQLGMPLAPVYIAEKPSDNPNVGVQFQWPAATGGTEGTGIRNEHLNYAIFWYSMAAVLAVIYIMSSRTRRPKSDPR